MNYLIIILIIFYFSKNKSGSLTSFLNTISYDDVLPLLKLFDQNNAFSSIDATTIQNVLSGNFNFQEILPLLTSVMGAFSTTNEPTFNSNVEVSGIEPIKDLFNDEFSTAIKNYFDN